MEAERMTEKERSLSEDLSELIDLAEHFLDRAHFYGGARKRLEAKIKEIKTKYE